MIGCRSGETDEPPRPVGFEDGTRLEARFWDGGDGALLFRTWYDTELQVECVFAKSTDGRRRCLPVGEGGGNADPNLWFSDPECSEPIAILRPCASPGAFVRARPVPTAACDEPSGIPIYELGAERSERSYYRRDSAGCRGAVLTDDDQVIFDLGRGLRHDVFVSAEEVVEGSGRLARRTLVAADAARRAVSLWDTARGAECEPRLDESRCDPSAYAGGYGALWSDTTCTEPVASYLGPACSEPTAVLAGISTGFLEVGAEVSPSAVHQSESGACVPYTSSFDPRYFLGGAPIPADSLPEAFTVHDGTGRLRAVRWTDEQGAELTGATSFYDTALELGCAPRALVGGMRCVPTAGYATVTDLFADPACQTPLVSWADVDPPAFALQVRDDSGSCGVLDEAFGIGESFAGDALYTSAGGACAERSLDPQATYYYLSGPADLAVIR